MSFQRYFKIIFITTVTLCLSECVLADEQNHPQPVKSANKKMTEKILLPQTDHVKTDQSKSQPAEQKNDTHSAVTKSNTKSNDVTTVAAEITKKITTIVQDKDKKYKNNSELSHQEVENVFKKVVAFSTVARGVMGRYVHRVSPKKFDEFVVVLEKTLLKFYSQMLCDYKGSQMKIIHVSPPDQDQVDRYKKKQLLYLPVEIKINDGKQNYLLTYSMMEDNGQWKIRNISVDGINIGIQFRNQFADAVKTYGSPDEVIRNWEKIMQNKAVKPATSS
ncbi:MAG: ABC transporter substrate-binding protein [Endozoicomonadaceae bacterium]|nr:ABC transporter substrate-binding protein [Endozoicomonadaceae bacterium]MCY4330060.1 ABC transporter substrate-binding protein [Endozoicomonadaceae bacterium]